MNEHRDKRRARIGWWFAGWALGSVAIHVGLQAFGQWSALRPGGGVDALSYSSFGWITGMLAFFLVPLMLLVALVARWRPGLIVANAATIWFVASIVGEVAGDRVRLQAMHRLARHSKPLIRAIEQFGNDQGRPPQDLVEFVPQYFPVAPRTDVGAYPSYELEVPGRTGNDWAIVVPMPEPFGFDEMVYLPRRNYGDSSRCQRIDEWAYYRN